jgi:hypothetical protein
VNVCNRYQNHKVDQNSTDEFDKDVLVDDQTYHLFESMKDADAFSFVTKLLGNTYRLPDYALANPKARRKSSTYSFVHCAS